MLWGEGPPRRPLSSVLGGEGQVLSLAMEPDTCLVMDRIVG